MLGTWRDNGFGKQKPVNMVITVFRTYIMSTLKDALTQICYIHIYTEIDSFYTEYAGS